MDQTQPWYASKAVWGGILAAAAPLAGALLHVTVSDTDITLISDSLAGIGAAVGGLLAVYGRVKATKAIGPAPKS